MKQRAAARNQRTVTGVIAAPAPERKPLPSIEERSSAAPQYDETKDCYRWSSKKS